MKFLITLLFTIIVSNACFSQVRISQLQTSSATNVDSLWFAILDAGTTKKIRGYQLKELFLSGQIKNISAIPPVYIDSISPTEYEIRIDTAGLGSGSGTIIPNNEIAFGNGTGITSNSDFSYSTGSGGLFNVGFSGNVILQKTGNNYYFGDKDGINNQTYMRIDDANKKFQFIADYLLMEGNNKVMGIGSAIAFGGAFLNHNETAGGTLSLSTPAGGTSNIGVTNVTGSKDHQMPNASGTIALRAADSTGSPINMVYQGTDGLFHKAAVPGGSVFKHIMSTTQPTDTSVGWINTNYDIYKCYPIQYYVNGQWSAVDSIGGRFWDNVGKVFSRGYPFVIIATGQSNLGGSYIGELGNPNVHPYHGYYGDTIPAKGVSAWNNNQNIWTVAKIRDTPFQYSSGANYLLLAAKKINIHTGRSVRIVTYPQGGTGLQCWAGVPGTPPQDSACYNEFKSRVQNSGVRNPDVFIWAQSEAGITPAPLATTYFDKWKEMVDSMIHRDHLMDTNTLKILMASGDTLTNGDVIQMANGTSAGEGALRALAATNDRSIKYVDAVGSKTELTDGLHFTPKGHEELSTRLYHSMMDGPKVPGRDMMGYGSPAPYKLSSVKQELGMGGLVAVNSAGKKFFDLESANLETIYTGATPNASSQYAKGLQFSPIAFNNVRLYGYNQNTFLQIDDARLLSSAAFVSNGSIQAYSGADPYYSLKDITTNKELRFYMDATSNTLRVAYDGTSLWGVTTTGQFGIGTYTPDASAKLQINSTTQGFLPPRMTATEGSAIGSPAEGLIIYVTNTNGTFTSKGWWGYDGAAWQKLNN